MKSTIRSLFAVLAAAVMLLTACETQDEPPVQDPVKDPVIVTAALGATPDSLDPAQCTTDGGETILFHLFENLLRWENNGSGFASLAPGQASSYTVETDYLGNATYTFTLREDIFWSDGQPVTAQQYVSAWQRLANPAHRFPHSALLSCIAGYDSVQQTGDVSQLKVSAADNRTLVVVLNGNPPSFLPEVCAGAYTMPVRTFLPGNAPITSVTNGAYTLTSLSEPLTVATETGTYQEYAVILTRSESYYDAGNVSVDQIRFISSSGSDADYAKFLRGTVDFAANIPASVLESIALSENWLPEPVTSTYGVVFNTQSAPFDSADVRSAFHLAIDEQAIVDALNDFALRPATGLVPYGVEDYGISAAAKEAKNSSDDSGKPPLVITNGYWDFRTHSEEIVTLTISDNYESDCNEARLLLASAGYPDGTGFPQAEYIYIDSPENSAVAKLLQAVWKKELGVTVLLRAVTSEEYSQLVGSTGTDGEAASPAFQIAAAEFVATDRYDVLAFLSRWHSASAENIAGYSSKSFDILISAARAAVAAETHDAYLHDAEAILLDDAPVVPLFYRGSSFAAADELTGLYRAPNGVFFFYQAKQSVPDN